MNRDLASGVMFMVLGALFVFGAFEYRLGSPARLGPGYLPAALGAILVLLGAAIGAKGVLGGSAAVNKIQLRPLAAIVAAIVIFAFGLRPLGFVVTTFVTVFIVTFAGPPIPLVQRVIPAILLAAFCTVAFVTLLGLPSELWPRFLG